MRRVVWLAVAWLAFLSAGLRAQGGPLLVGPAGVVYPPIAKAAHVSGEVVVRFAIDSDGRAVAVETVSGPAMLRSAVESRIKQWRFRVPPPMGAKDSFEARYTFHAANEKGEEVEDDLDEPPFVPCCGDSIMLSYDSYKVTGEVRSLDGSQTIDVSTVESAAPVIDRCAGDKERLAPVERRPEDYVELYRLGCTGSCLVYRVRVYRDGLVEWHGREGVAVLGNDGGRIQGAAAEALLDKFSGASYWGACPAEYPPANQDPAAEDFSREDFLSVRIDGHVKSVAVESYTFAQRDAGPRFAWAVDQAADTHRWRHGDAARESLGNMRADLMLPKPAMTALIRATYRFKPGDATQTVAPLKKMIANGVDLNAADESGWTALMYAAGLGNPDGEETPLVLLVKAKAAVNKASVHGDTALMVAAYGGEWSKALVKAGAEVNARNGEGTTALMLLAQRSDADTLQAALADGADAKLTDDAGRTALDYLRLAGCGKAVLVFPEYRPAERGKVVPCPSKDESYRERERILVTAMRGKGP